MQCGKLDIGLYETDVCYNALHIKGSSVRPM